MDISSSQSSVGSQFISLDNSINNSLTTALTNHISGEGTVTGSAALLRVEEAIAAKQKSTASSTTSSSTGPSNGFSSVQNLMQSLDNITINNGSSGSASTTSGLNPLMSVDQAIAIPKVNIKA